MTMDIHKPEKLFHFVTIRDPSTKTKRGSDMRLSQARSHAARITHMRKKRKNQKPPDDEPVSLVYASWGNTTPGGDDESNMSKLEYSPSPLSLLGQHKVDPFESYPTGPLPPYLRHCLEYGELQLVISVSLDGLLTEAVYECIHPSLISSTCQADVSTIKASWRRIGLEWPLMYHLQVAGAANLVRADARNPQLPNDVEILRLKHQAQGLGLLMSALQNLKEPASDALLMAMVMAGMLTDPSPSQIPELYRASPLATAQHLHIYARLTLVPATMRTMLESVGKRGGIGNIHEYGMVSILQLLVPSSLVLDFTDTLCLQRRFTS